MHTTKIGYGKPSYICAQTSSNYINCRSVSFLHCEWEFLQSQRLDMGDPPSFSTFSCYKTHWRHMLVMRKTSQHGQCKISFKLQMLLRDPKVHWENKARNLVAIQSSVCWPATLLPARLQQLVSFESTRDISTLTGHCIGAWGHQPFASQCWWWS